MSGLVLAAMIHGFTRRARLAWLAAACGAGLTAAALAAPPAAPAAAAAPSSADKPGRPAAAPKKASVVTPAKTSAPVPAKTTAAAAPADPKAAALLPWCKPIAARLASLALDSCLQSGLTPSGTKSVQGFPILQREYLPAAKGVPGKRPVKVLLIGGIHGDELTAPAIVFRWMQWMQQPQAQEFHWSVAPLVNPDGFLNKKATRMNANGVDLNRNFPTPHWHQEASAYWVKRTGRDPRRFPGKEPLSEPESQWVNDEIARFDPDLVISVHAPFGVLDFDGPVQPPRKFGRLVFTPVGVYPGSLGNYSGVHKKVPIVTIELPHALSMPNEAESKKIWQDMLVWISANVTPQKPAAAPVRQVAGK